MEVSVITSEAEHAVLSALVTSPESIRFARPILDPEDFHHPQSESLFQLLLDMDSAGSPISAASVAAESVKRGLRITPADVGSLLRGTGNSGSVAYYAQIVRSDSVRRQLVGITAQAQQALADPSSDISTVIQSIVTGARAVQDTSGGDSYRAKPLGEIMDMEDTYEWVIPGLLEKRDRVIVTAAEGSGKTTFIRQMAIASAAGIHPFQFTRIRPVRVMVIDSENSERQWRRASGRILHAAQTSEAAGDPLTNVRVACIPRTSITRDKELGKIHRMIDDFQPEIVAIGPLYRLAPGSMNSDEDVAPVLAALDTIRDTGAAMVIEGHAGKGANSAGTRDLRPRGSSALLGWPEFGFGIAPSENSRGTFDIQRWRGDREERHWPESLARGSVWPWVDASTAGMPRFAA